MLDQGLLEAMGKRSIIAIHSTIRPSTCVSLHKRAAERGVVLLDLPVSGFGHAALSRTLLVMCGGDAHAVARIVHVLECYAGTIRSEENTSELQSLMRISYAVFCLK